MSTTRYHIAAKSLRGALPAYAKRFDLLEVVIAVAAPPPTSAAAAKLAKKDRVRPPPASPTVGTLRKWRKAVPPHFEFSVVAGPHVALLKHTPEFERELGAARDAMDALQARCFVVRTPPEVTPSALWRDRLGKLFARFPKDVTNLVWEPSGLWEIEDAAVAARKWGVTVCVDASREPVPGGQIAYARLRALGETRSFGPAALERIVRSIGPRRDVYVVLETDTALEECKRLRQIAQRSPSSGEGGMSRLVRPRGGIVVRDDEQE
jgi:uncharacterized protein YecE (DUF72 family)